MNYFLTAYFLGNICAKIIRSVTEWWHFRHSVESRPIHHITSHWDDRCRPPRPLYPRNKCLSYEFI